MENLFNNPLLIKAQEFGQKLGTNKFISALTAGMMATMAPIMVGSICQIICAVISLFNADFASSALYGYIYAPYNYTMGLLGLWVTTLVAYNYAKNLKMKSPVSTAINSTIVFTLIAAPIANGGLTNTFLGTTGMFIGFVVAWGTVSIEKFCFDKNIRIPMPEVCPPSLVNAFAAIVPLAINVLVFYGLNTVLSVFTGGAITLTTLINTILYVPLSMLLSTPGMFVICFLACLLWCFGIHGTMIVYPVLMADMINAAATNAQLHAAGEPLMFFPTLLFAGVALLGGTGNTWPLCFMGLKAKSEQIRAVSKVALVPGFFGINEPVAFGMPIMYNPILAIPYCLNPLVVMILYYFAYQTGLIMPPWISITALLPVGVGAFLGTLNIMNTVFVYLMMIPVGLIWYPFFKVYDNQLYAQEQAAKNA